MKFEIPDMKNCLIYELQLKITLKNNHVTDYMRIHSVMHLIKTIRLKLKS